jgi:hypothetical protein
MEHWRLDNTAGYTQADPDALKAEFVCRFVAGEWPGAEGEGEAAQ